MIQHKTKPDFSIGIQAILEENQNKSPEKEEYIYRANKELVKCEIKKEGEEIKKAIEKTKKENNKYDINIQKIREDHEKEKIPEIEIYIKKNPANEGASLSLSINDSKHSFTGEPFIEEKKGLNSILKKRYLAKNLYDKPLCQNNSNLPDIYEINERFSAFVYPNDCNTYYITASGVFEKKGFIVKIMDQDTGEKEYKYEYGLYFCGVAKDIKINGKTEKKICNPNSFMCKNCMEKNKRKYGIQKRYFININGRIVKKNKDKYHCFGHFLEGNQIENCIDKFTCEACKFFNECKHYYMP